MMILSVEYDLVTKEDTGLGWVGVKFRGANGAKFKGFCLALFRMRGHAIIPPHELPETLE
jgi:hypothetical protein